MCVQRYHVLTLLLKGNSVTEQVNIQVPWFDLLTSKMRNICLGVQLGAMSHIVFYCLYELALVV